MAFGTLFKFTVNNKVTVSGNYDNTAKKADPNLSDFFNNKPRGAPKIAQNITVI
jgi:hypothetical protein